MRVRAFNALTQQSRATTLLGIMPRRCFANSLGGPPTLVWIMRRALEGGPAAPWSPLLVTPQGQTMTSGQRERHPRRCQSCAAIPAPAAPRRALLQLL
jgi:hypothetical protein